MKLRWEGGGIMVSSCLSVCLSVCPIVFSTFHASMNKIVSAQYLCISCITCQLHLYCCYASAFRRQRHVFRLSIRLPLRPKPEIPSFHLYMGLLVHPANCDRFVVCPSVRPSVRPSIPKGFWAFAGECREGMAWNFACWCILTTFRSH